MIANQILDQYWEYGVLPINPIKIATMMGINFSISYRTGFIKEKTIFINPLNSNIRNNFIVAHLLGHYVLHGSDFIENPLNFRLVSDFRELEANYFALRLLMPSKYIKIIVRKYTNLNDISNIFQVSEIACAIRLKQLRLI